MNCYEIKKSIIYQIGDGAQTIAFIGVKRKVTIIKTPIGSIAYPKNDSGPIPIEDCFDEDKIEKEETP